MKRVLVIVPFPMSAENLAQRRAQLNDVQLGPGISFDFVPVKAAPKNYVSASDMILAEIGALEAGLRAEAEGYDAVCIDTMSDSGLAALRSALPVLLESRGDRARAILEAMSDPSTEPIPQAKRQGAYGAPPPADF